MAPAKEYSSLLQGICTKMAKWMVSTRKAYSVRSLMNFTDQYPTKVSLGGLPIIPFTKGAFSYGTKWE